MSETIPSVAEQKNADPTKFRIEVSIKGLPYIFEGVVPEEPNSFEWTVSVPDAEEQAAKVEELVATGQYSGFMIGDLKSKGLGDGKVGIIQPRKVMPKDGVLSVRPGVIRTDTAYIPKESPYHNANGVGSFLLDNLCALADYKGWRIYLNPVDRGGKLFQHELYAWYQGRGFLDNYQLPEETRAEYLPMMRWPQEPDSSQPILSVIPASAAK